MLSSKLLISFSASLRVLLALRFSALEEVVSATYFRTKIFLGEYAQTKFLHWWLTNRSVSPMAVYTLFPFIGPVLGPVLSG